MALTNPINQAGTFRASIKEYALKDYQSGAIGCYVIYSIESVWNGEDWDDWTEYQVEAEGTIWLQKKDGTLNDRSIKQMVDLGWDGDFQSIVYESWEPPKVQIVTKREEYEGNERFPVKFVNDYDSKPGIQSMDPEKAKALQTKFGSQIRAIVGNTKANGTKPAGKPSAPPKSPPAGKGMHSRPDIPESQQDQNVVPF